MTEQHKNFKDITGHRFGRLTVLEFVERRGRYPYWKCVCDCGNVVIKPGYSMLQGNTKSCGCLAQEHSKKAKFRKHKYKNDRVYSVWRAMLSRCENPNNLGFQRYGGRGICICDEWKDPEIFAEWALSHGFKDGYSIERINNDGPYCPENCRFATTKEQANNRCTNVFVEYNGERKTITEWAEQTSVSANTLFYRYRHGWDFGVALNTPPNGIPKGTPVNQYDKSGNLIATFKSSHEASRQTGIFTTSICDACNGKLKTAGGYIWKRQIKEE